MSLKNCAITFNNCPHGVFFSGEAVSGTIYLRMEKKKQCKVLALKISGEANVRWNEHRGTGKDRKTIHYRGKDIYFKTNNNLFPLQTDNSGMTELALGDHRFNFTFIIPHNLPSSYEGAYGCVRYIAKVSLKRANKFDLSYRVPFTVLSNVNLNLFPHIRVPIDETVTKDFYFLISKKGSLSLKIEIPISGFVSGQVIPIKCLANNEGKVKVPEIAYSLIRTTTFRSTMPHSKTRTETIKVAYCPSEGVAANEEKIIQSLMPIPALPPSSLTTLSIINIQYFFKVKAKVTGMHGDLRGLIPITIGTTPFFNNPYLQQPSSSDNLGPPPTYTEFAPPTYEEVVVEKRMEEDPVEWHNMTNFTPRYPIYHSQSKDIPDKH